MSWLEPDRAIVTPGRKQQRLPNLNETHIHPQNSPEAPHTEAKNNTKHEKGKKTTRQPEDERKRKKATDDAAKKENRTRRKRLTTSCQLRKKARQQIQGFWATCVVLWLDN